MPIKLGVEERPSTSSDWDVSLGVEPAYHRQGIGERLLQEAIAFARRAGLAWLEIGFIEVGRLPDQFRIGQMSIEDVAMVLQLDPHLPARHILDVNRNPE